MATVRVQTNIAGMLVAIEATGVLGDKLTKCQTAADVIKVFGDMQKALDALERIQAFKPSGASLEYGWQGVDSLLTIAGLSRMWAGFTASTPITVIDLDPAQQ